MEFPRLFPDRWTPWSRTLLQKAETDWQHLGALDPAVKVESTESKRSSEIPPIYSPKKLCISQNIPELEDLKLMAVELTNSFSQVFVSWFVRRVFLVNVRLGEQQSRTLLRRMQALPKEGMGSKPMDEGKTVTDTGVIRVLAAKIGLPREDLVTVKLHQECQEQFLVPTSASVTDEVFGAAGVLPDELNSPSESISTNVSLVPISLSPATRSPPHDTRIAEYMQEVPVNRALSPVHSSKPVGDLPLSVECPPALNPTPLSLAHIPQALVSPGATALQEHFLGSPSSWATSQGDSLWSSEDWELALPLPRVQGLGFSIDRYSPAHSGGNVASKELAAHDCGTATSGLAVNGSHTLPGGWTHRKFPGMRPRHRHGQLQLPGLTRIRAHPSIYHTSWSGHDGTGSLHPPQSQVCTGGLQRPASPPWPHTRT